MQVQTPKHGYKFIKSFFGRFEEIPDEWHFKHLSETGKIIGTPDSVNKEYWNGDIPWAVPTDITKLKGNFIEITEKRITQKGLENSSARLLRLGDAQADTAGSTGDNGYLFFGDTSIHSILD